MYDPKIGQFLSEDPIEFEALDPNLRRYVGNSSTMLTDPTGLAEESPFWSAPEGSESALGATFYAQTKKAPPPKRGPTPDKLGWGDYKKVTEPPDGSDKSAFTGTDPFTNRSGLDVVPKDGGKVSLKPYEFRLEFDPRQSWYVDGKNTGPLLEHERLHLAMFQEMARQYTEYMRSQSITLTGTTPKAIIKNLNDQLNAMEQKFKDFAQGVSDKYDADTMHGASRTTGRMAKGMAEQNQGILEELPQGPQMKYFHCMTNTHIQWFLVGAILVLASPTGLLRGEDKPKLSLSLRTSVVRMVPGDTIELEHYTDPEFKREEVGEISYHITQLSYYHRKGARQIYFKAGESSHTSIGDEFSGLNGVLAATSGGFRWDYSDEKRVGYKVEGTALRLGTYLIQVQWKLRRRDKDGGLTFERVRSDPAIVFVELPIVKGVRQVEVASRPESMSGATLQFQQLLEEEFPGE